MPYFPVSFIIAMPACAQSLALYHYHSLLLLIQELCISYHYCITVYSGVLLPRKLLFNSGLKEKSKLKLSSFYSKFVMVANPKFWTVASTSTPQHDFVIQLQTFHRGWTSEGQPNQHLWLAENVQGMDPKVGQNSRETPDQHGENRSVAYNFHGIVLDIAKTQYHLQLVYDTIHHTHHNTTSLYWITIGNPALRSWERAIYIIPTLGVIWSQTIKAIGPQVPFS